MLCLAVGSPLQLPHEILIHEAQIGVLHAWHYQILLSHAAAVRFRNFGDSVMRALFNTQCQLVFGDLV